MLSTNDINQKSFLMSLKARRGAFASQNEVTLIKFSDLMEQEKLSGNKRKALEYALKELEAKKFGKITSETALLFNNIGFIYYMMGQVEDAQNCLNASLELLIELKGNQCVEYEEVTKNLEIIMGN